MFYIATCPHCNKHDLALTVVCTIPRVAPLGNLYLNCPNCNEPSCATAYANWGQRRANDWVQVDQNVESLGIEIQEVWPKVATPNIPEHLPQEIVRALKQAESNFIRPEHEEASAVMYRKALELAMKRLDPNLKGTLASRISELYKQGKLTSDLKDWAGEIKNLGNDGAHEVEAIEPDELKALRGLTEMVLRYVFTLPEAVKLLRETPK